MPIQQCLDLLRELSINPGMNETARKELFMMHLLSIFPDAPNKSMLTALASGAETYTYTEPSLMSSSTYGFVDTLNGSLMIEFKSNLLNHNQKDKAITELKRYTASQWNAKGAISTYCCVATDILNWQIYRPIPNKTPSDGVYTADMVYLEDIEVTPTYKPNWEHSEHLYNLLKRILIEQNLLKIDATNILRDFGIYSNLYEQSLPVIKKIIIQAQHSPESNLAMCLWQEYQDYHDRSRDIFDIDLYSKQVYLVILSRLMVAACLKDRESRIVDDKEIFNILNGDFFKENRYIDNLVEHDFFYWFINDPWINQLLPITRPIYHNLCTYDFRDSSKENILRLIYDELMLTGQRDALGQRSTPEELVFKIINAALHERQLGYNYLDPACGSGTFIRMALLETRAKFPKDYDKQKQLEILTNSITGIDVDPVSVMLSKANWILTLVDLIPYAKEPIEIPIYQADSLFVIKNQINKYGHFYSDPIISFDNTNIKVPIELFRNTSSFDKFINWCQSTSKTIANESVSYGRTPQLLKFQDITNNLPTIFGDDYTPEIEKRSDELANSIARLVNELVIRIINKKNGIWAFILRNSYRPSLMAGHFDVIATNPPWLAMSHLPNVNYEDELKSLANKFNIMPSGESSLHLEIATTFMLHNVYHYLSDGGIAAFILPHTIFDGNHHDPFRMRKYASIVPFFITCIWDIGNIPDLFKIPGCVVFGVKNGQEAAIYDKPISGLLCNSITDSQGVKRGLITLSTLGEKTAWKWNIGKVPMKMDLVKSFNYYTKKFKQGADLMPRTAVFVDIKDNTSSNKIVSVCTSKVERNNKNNKRLKGLNYCGFISKKYLFTTVTSNHLLPFVILKDQLPIVLLPVEFTGGIPSILSNEELILRGDASTAEWFGKINNELQKEKEGPSQEIQKLINVRGKLTQQCYCKSRFLIHYGAGGKYPCAGIYRVGETSKLYYLADQTTYVYGTDNEDEAYYLIGMFNAPLLQDLISDFQAKGKFKERHIHKLAPDVIPPFNSDIPIHREVVELSKNIEKAAYNILNNRMQDLSIDVRVRRKELRDCIIIELNVLNELAFKVLKL